jgi:hypothetical protein
MQKGGYFVRTFASSQESQQTDDGEDFDDERIKEVSPYPTCAVSHTTSPTLAVLLQEFSKIKSSTWMQKKLDKTTSDLGKLMQQHESSKKALIAPVKEMMNLYPERKKALTLMSGLLSDACTDSDLREMFIEAGNVLKSQVKMVESIQDNMKVIQIGNMCLEEKKAEEASVRKQSSSAMSAAAALISGVSSSKKARRK